MTQNKEDHFKRHTDLLKKHMDNGAWGKFSISLQNGYIVQSILTQTFVTDTTGEGLISQPEAETRAESKKEKKKTNYRFIKVIDKEDNKGGDG